MAVQRCPSWGPTAVSIGVRCRADALLQLPPGAAHSAETGAWYTQPTLAFARPRDRRRGAMDPIAQLAINTIRTLSIDAVQKANSGHPGLPLGAAPMAYTLWQRHLKHNPPDPKWPDRDRFVLSAGHGCDALYALLHLTGYDLPLEDLKKFRQWGSSTPGHPETLHDPGRRGHHRSARARAPPTRSAWRSPSDSSPTATTAPATRSSTTTPTRWSPTAT